MIYCLTQQAKEYRIREEEEALKEKLRLNEILSICAEYEKQQNNTTNNNSFLQDEKSYFKEPSLSPTHTITPNRFVMSHF